MSKINSYDNSLENRNESFVQKNVSENKLILSVVKLVGLGLVLFFIVGVLITDIFKRFDIQSFIQTTAIQLHTKITEEYCPDYRQLLSHRICPVTENNDSIRQALAEIPDLESAMALLQWRGASEQEAVKYTALVSALMNGGWSTYSLQENKKPWSISRNALQPLWDRYPQMVAASRCYYCTYHASNIYEMYNSAPDKHNQWLSDYARTTPHQLNQLHQRLGIQGQELLSLVQLHSRLAFVGTREYFHAKILRQNKDRQHTLALVRNTNSAAPFWEANLNEVPQDLVKLSWEQGVRSLDDHPKFTRHLVATGYKPALRWLVWILADAENFSNLRKMHQLKGQYQAILDQFTEDGLTAEVYSKNWDKISWDENLKKWVY